MEVTQNLVPAAPRLAIGFLDLPYELRLKIYLNCLPHNVWFTLPIDSFDEGLLSYLHGSPGFYSANQPWGIASRAAPSPAPLSVPDQASPLSISELAELIPWEELDDRIYKSKYGRTALPNILRVSRQMSDEASDVLYGANVFKIRLGPEAQSALKRQISETNRRRLRHVCLVLNRYGHSTSPSDLDAATWDSVLPYLTRLTIIADQPYDSAGNPGYTIGQADLDNLEKWGDWFISILESLDKSLSTQCTVLVDADKDEELVGFVRELLSRDGRPVQQVQTEHADLIFKRGKFSLESGYWDERSGGVSGHDWYDGYES